LENYNELKGIILNTNQVSHDLCNIEYQNIRMTLNKCNQILAEEKIQKLDLEFQLINLNNQLRESNNEIFQKNTHIQELRELLSNA